MINSVSGGNPYCNYINADNSAAQAEKGAVAAYCDEEASIIGNEDSVSIESEIPEAKQAKSSKKTKKPHKAHKSDASKETKKAEAKDESGEKKESKIAEIGDKLLDAYFTLEESLDVFPSFIYPSVTGGTAEEIAYTYKILDKLPLADVTSVQNIEWVDELFMSADKTAHASGTAYSALSPYIKIARDQCGDLGKWAEKVIIHETGHTRDYSEGFFSIIDTETSNSDIWGHGARITEYAKTNEREDFAESFMTYYTDPEKLKATCPEKYERIKELEETGKFDALVEKDAFRETGKWIGEKMSKVPYLQNAIVTADYAISGISLALDTASLVKGVATGDEESQMHGAMGATASILSFAGMPIAGAAVDGARRAMGRAIEKGEITAEEANYVSTHSVGAPLTGIVKLGNWACSKIFKSKAKEQESSKEAASSEIKPTAAEETSEAKESDGTTAESVKEKATFKSSIKAMAIAAGGGIGSVAGSIGGIYAGVTAGFAIGGPVGGAIGLIAGTVIGNAAMNRLGAKIGSVIVDKIQGHKPEKNQKESSDTDPVKTQETKAE